MHPTCSRFFLKLLGVSLKPRSFFFFFLFLATTAGSKLALSKNCHLLLGRGAGEQERETHGRQPPPVRARAGGRGLSQLCRRSVGVQAGRGWGGGVHGPRGLWAGSARGPGDGQGHTEEGFCVEPVSRPFLCFCFMSPHSWSRGPSGPCDRGAASEVCAPRENDGRAQLRALCMCVCACPGFNPCTRVGVRACACVHLLRVCVRRPVSISVHAHTCAHAPLCVCVCARVSRRALCPLCFLNTDDTDSSTVLRLSQSQRPSELSDFGTTLPRRKLRPRGPA